MTISVMRREIAEQPRALEHLISSRRPDVTSVAHRIIAFAPEWATIAARGSSDNAARYAQVLLGARHRLGVALAVPSLHTLYGTPPRLARSLVIGISQSGRSPDVVEVIANARRQGALTLAIVNDRASPLAQAAELVLDLGVGREDAVAATKTYSSTLALLAMLSAALADDGSAWAELSALPDFVEAALAAAPAADDAARRLRAAERYLVLGRGYNYATAFEAALKMKETADVLAEPFSFADLMHGPVALVRPGLPVVLVAPTGRADADATHMAQLLEARGAATILITDRQDLAPRASSYLPLPPSVPEWLSPIVAIVPGQLFAHALASARGCDPDAPRGLSKVTLTR